MQFSVLEKPINAIYNSNSVDDITNRERDFSQYSSGEM
jgi:hypothetical protein